MLRTVPLPRKRQRTPDCERSVGEPLPRRGGGGPAQPVEGAATWTEFLVAQGLTHHALPLRRARAVTGLKRNNLRNRNVYDIVNPIGGGES